MKKNYISWNYYIDSCNLLADKLKDQNFTDIITIARGGHIPAAIVAYKLGIQRIYSHGVYSYDMVQAGERIKFPSHYQFVESNFTDRNVLVIDEICDTGYTFVDLRKHLAERGGNGQFIFASIFYKTNNIYKPDYFIEEVPSDTWIVMPYDP